MKLTAFWSLAVLGIVACGKGDGQPGAAALDTARRDLQLAPVDTTAQLGDVAPPAESLPPVAAPAAQPAPPTPAKPKSTASKPAAAAPAPSAAPAPPVTRTLASGTAFTAALRDSIDSKTSVAGNIVTMRVASDVTDANGRVVIPKGSTVTARIETIKWSENKGDKGTLKLVPTSVAIGDASHDIQGTVANPAFAYRKRGGALGDASKVAGGAAAGAIVGGLLGKGTGAAIGGVVGGAVGTQRAIETKDRDIILAPGSEMTVTLSSTFTR